MLGRLDTVPGSFEQTSDVNNFRQGQRFKLTPLLQRLSMMSTENVGFEMSQHFLLSAKARSLSLAKVARLSDEEAYQTFKLVRWAATNGDPVCPRCGCLGAYAYTTRKLFKCKGCDHNSA
jgi:hypothetical protein